MPAGTSKPTGHIDPGTNALDYALDRIEHELAAMLREADAAEHAETIEALVMDPVIGHLRDAAASAPAPTESRRIELTPEIRELVGL